MITEPDKSKIPNKVFVRWGEMILWLGEEGISVRQVKKLCSAGKIQRYYVRRGSRALYSVRQIFQVVWKKDLKIPAMCRGH